MKVLCFASYVLKPFLNVFFFYFMSFYLFFGSLFCFIVVTVFALKSSMID